MRLSSLCGTERLYLGIPLNIEAALSEVLFYVRTYVPVTVSIQTKASYLTNQLLIRPIIISFGIEFSHFNLG